MNTANLTPAAVTIGTLLLRGVVCLQKILKSNIGSKQL